MDQRKGLKKGGGREDQQEGVEEGLKFSVCSQLCRRQLWISLSGLGCGHFCSLNRQAAVGSCCGVP